MSQRIPAMNVAPRGRWIRLLLLPLVCPVVTGCVATDAAPATGPWTTSPIEETRPLFTTDFPPEEFAERREAVYDAMGSSGIAILQGAPTPVGFVRFRQSNEFYYLTGIESPHAYVILDGSERKAAVYLANRHERREFGEGKVLSAEDADLVKELAGVDEVHSTDVLVEHLRQRGRSGALRTVFTPLTEPEGAAATRGMAARAQQDRDVDPLDGQPSRRQHFVERLKGLLPGVPVEDLSPILDRQRVIKSPRELELIRTSTRLHGLAILETMRSTSPGMTEYEMEATARYIFWQHGVQGEAYYGLNHIGPNAYMNHYHAGVRAAEPGDMILMDYGADYRYYVSDMGRMWPADGRFNDVQRELYGFYLAFYEAILARIRPGVTAQQVKLEALEEVDRVLEGWEFSRPEHEAAARSFVESYREGAQNPATRLGHWVGMAAHDPGIAEGPLRPGMVFVIEPQFRVPETKIYVRLEDTIAITGDGVEIFSDFVPRDIESIERLVRQDGMLQAYPRLLDESGAFLAPATALLGQASAR